MKKFIKVILGLIILVALYFAFLFIFLTVTDYKPEMLENITVEGNCDNDIINNDTLSLLTWNIGYCGLGKEMDFFYDKGSQVRTDEETTKKNLEGIKTLLKAKQYVDFILLQEVDKKSKRSYRINQVDSIAKALPEFCHSFARNYDVRFIPAPFTKPYGKVVAGQMTLSKHKPSDAKRFGFQANYSWPKKTYMLDRCFIFSRYKLNSGKDLVIMNTHNSAWADAAGLREKELEKIKQTMLEEEQKGNYVICGGDWNINPLGFDKGQVSPGYAKYTTEEMKPDFFPKSWNWCFDPNIPTNRALNIKYKKGETETSIIDYYLTTGNIEILEIKTVDLDFVHSDHQPVCLKVILK